MRIRETRPVDGCLPSAPVREYVVEPPVDEPLMRRLADGGRLQYFPHFPRPYFRIDRPRGYVAQAVIGSDRVRVTYSPSAPEDVEQLVRRLIESEDR